MTEPLESQRRDARGRLTPEELERMLDERLEDTFPASDPVGPIDRSFYRPRD